MKNYQSNSCSVRAIVRFGAVILIAMVGLGLATESVRNSRDYSITSKPRPKLREIRALNIPHRLYTAVNFGKRTSDYQPSNLYRHDSAMFLPVNDDMQRFPVDWFIQYLLKNPEMANRVERKLLFDDETPRPSAAHRFKKDSNEDTYYFNV